MSDLDGRTVVTADHGDMFGERAAPLLIREWGRPPGIYTDPLVSVPWHVHESGFRRHITRGESTGEDESVDEDVRTDRLDHLGYAG